MSDVFISYARADEPVARKVAAALQSAGHSVWWDEHLPAHGSYSDVIQKNLEEARAVVVLWSVSAARSQWVRAEADLARNRGKLVQAQIDGTMPPLPFNQIQCADLRGWRGSLKHPGWAKLADSVVALLAVEARAPADAAPASRRRRGGRTAWIAAGITGLLLAGLLAFLLFGRGETEERPVLAVLPFSSLSPADAGLVAGIWEDTRQAIAKNPDLVVLGPNTSHELAEKGQSVARKAADFLLEASVRTAGDRVRVSASLVRSKDGAQIWSETFDRRLDDIFGLQQEVSREIEGRIRGRLAEMGGIQPENIATSGEVYALYSEARAKIRMRQPSAYQEAVEQLHKVVSMDPNFAPGWATLAVAAILDPASAGPHFENAERYARRATTLAPNLAAGHAALALALDGKGPVAEAAVRRALELDPQDFESLNWLAGMVARKGNEEEALELYSRAAEVEPLWWPAILNKVNLLLERGDHAAVDQEIARLKKLDGDALVILVEVTKAQRGGDLSAVAKTGVDFLRTASKEDREFVGFSLWTVLLQLGYEREADEIGPAPPFGPYLRRNDPKGLEMVEALKLPPRRFFKMGPLPMVAGRVYLLTGRGEKFAENYRAAVGSADEMLELVGADGFVAHAPLVAIALRDSGDAGEAARVLELAQVEARKLLQLEPTPRWEAMLARIYAAQGRREEALQMLTRAVERGWVPQPPEMLTDIALDPALNLLANDPRFVRVREHILAYLRKERAELGPVKL